MLRPAISPGKNRSRLAPFLVTAVLLGGLAYLIFPGDGARLALGPCTPGREGVGGAAGELLETRNFDASRAATQDLEAGGMDTEEHRVCVGAFKEGHYFPPGVEDGSLIPDSYGGTGVLKPTRSGTKVQHGAERGSPQGIAGAGVEAEFARLLLERS